MKMMKIKEKNIAEVNRKEINMIDMNIIKLIEKAAHLLIKEL